MFLLLDMHLLTHSSDSTVVEPELEHLVKILPENKQANSEYL